MRIYEYFIKLIGAIRTSPIRNEYMLRINAVIRSYNLVIDKLHDIPELLRKHYVCITKTVLYKRFRRLKTRISENIELTDAEKNELYDAINNVIRIVEEDTAEIGEPIVWARGQVV